MKKKLGVKYIGNNKGFTLIELMVTVILIALVLTLAYNMMTASNRIFAQGDAKADVQSSLRISGDFISDKLRYASNVKILATLPADITAGTKEYIYEEDGKLKHYDGYTISDVPGVLDGVQTEVYFEDRNSQAVLIRLNAELKEQVYEVETAANLLNIGDSILVSGSGPVIEFLPGIPINANMNARPIETITIKTVPEGTVEVPVDGHVAFIADVLPTDASQKTVRWVFESPVAYATIESTSATTGLLKFNGAVAGDSVTVKAHAMDGSGVESDFPITITVTEDAPDVTDESVTVQSVYDSIFQKNGTLQMTAKITPDSSSHKAVTWSLSAGSNLATISPDGMLKTQGSNSGNGTISVTATLGDKSDTKLIQVITNIDQYNVSIDGISSSISDEFDGAIIKCTLLGNKPATKENGVLSVSWDIKEKDNKNTTVTIVQNADGTANITATPQNKNSYFILQARINPISGDGFYIIKRVDFDY